MYFNFVVYVYMINKSLSHIFNHFVLESGFYLQKTGKDSTAPSILFCFFDAGETFALKPVIEEMKREGIPYNIIALGTSWSLMREEPGVLDIYEKFHWPQDDDLLKWDRHLPISTKVINRIKLHCRPDIFITGMVSQFQLQLCEIFKKQNAEILAFYDAFAPLEADAIQAKFIDLATQVLVPSKNVSDSIRGLYPSCDVHIVGQPTLENWMESLKGQNLTEIKQQLKITDEKSILLFVGGYGEEYENAFELFAEAITPQTGTEIIISLHPKTDGGFERNILAAKASKIHFVGSEILTSHLVAIADVVLTVHSTVGVQASFLGKPVIYVHTPEMNYTSLAIEQAWASKVTNVAELQDKIREALTSCVCRWDRFEGGNIPREASKMIYSRISATEKWMKGK